MPLQERFGALPMWACLVACPVSEITSFVADSSRSRKFVIIFWFPYLFFENGSIETETLGFSYTDFHFLYHARSPDAAGRTPTLDSNSKDIFHFRLYYFSGNGATLS
jgi:hypothetical protein